MKTIFTNTELVHTFAQQTQQEGRTSTNGMFFVSNKIYSYGYHYLLAEILPNNVVLINDSGYSNSTAKHINLITNATRQYKQYFFNDICFNNVYNSVTNASKSIVKAIKKERYANEIITKFESFTNFLNLFDKAIIKGYNEYHLQDKRVFIKDEKYKEIKKIYKAIEKNKDLFVEQAKEREAKAKIKEEKKYKEQLTKFFNYEINYITNKTKIDYLRISEDKTQIETTQNVKVSIDEAKQLYNMIEQGKDIKGVKISNYVVISLNGVLKIGCHNINTDNMKQIGELIKSL
jgi:hypothetical protein